MKYKLSFYWMPLMHLNGMQPVNYYHDLQELSVLSIHVNHQNINNSVFP